MPRSWASLRWVRPRFSRIALRPTARTSIFIASSGRILQVAGQLRSQQTERCIGRIQGGTVREVVPIGAADRFSDLSVEAVRLFPVPVALNVRVLPTFDQRE